MSQPNGETSQAASGPEDPLATWRDATELRAAADVEELRLAGEWAKQRLTFYERVDQVVREQLSHAVRTVGDSRVELERAADDLLARLRAEKDRRVQAIQSLHQQLRAVQEETERRRQEGEAEIRSLVEKTEANTAALVQTTEERRSQMIAEVQVLEEQVAQVQQALASFLNTRLASLRGALQPAGAAVPPAGPAPAPAPAAAAAPEAPPVPVPAPRRRAVAERAPAAAAYQAPEASSPSAPAAAAPPVPGTSEPTPAAAAPAPLEAEVAHAEAVTSEPGPAAAATPAAAAAAGQPQRLPSAAGPQRPAGEEAAAEATTAPSIEREPAAAQPASEAASSPTIVPAAQPVADDVGQVQLATSQEGVLAPPARTGVLIAEIPGFSSALGLQRAIQALEGVQQAKAIGYEKGVLSMEITHDPTRPLVDQLLSLPGAKLRVLRAEPDSIELALVSS